MLHRNSWLMVLSVVLVQGLAGSDGTCMAAGVPSSNSLLSISSDDSLVVCSNRDSRSVTVFSRNGLQKQFEIEVGLHPEGTTFVGSSHLVACCVYGSDQIVILDTQSGKIVKRIDVFDEPYGIVTSADGKYLYATLEYPGTVLRINTSDWSIDGEWQVGSMLRGIALSPDGGSVYVSEYLTTRLIQIDSATGKFIADWAGSSTDNLCRQVVVHPTLPKAYLPHIRSKVTAAHGNGSIFPYVAAVTTAHDDSARRVRIPMDSFRGARVVANPWEVAVSPDGKLLYSLFGGTNDLYVAEIVNDDYQELQYVAAMRLGSNPRAVRVSHDGSSLYIYNAMDFEVVEYSTTSLEKVSSANVTDNPLPDQLRLGKSLFYTALQPMSGRQWISCSSCHPDGDADGRTWQQPEGLRQTQPLFGLAWTHPLHWSADRDEVQDFEHTIQGKLMQGRGLMRGSLPDALAESITGRSEALDALAAYTNSHQFTLSPHAKNGLSDAAKRGQKLFHSEATQCAQCHSGPFYSDSKAGSADAFIRHDVGTGNDDPSELMGPKYDTPTLLGLYRSAPYLHHGKAETLKDLLTTANPDDRHGHTSHLTSSEVEDLVEFLKALPFEDPEPQAQEAGMLRISAVSETGR